MSHSNISRDVDIDAYVLQKDTAINPYIVHMKTDLNLVPKVLRTDAMLRKADVKKRAKIIQEYGKKIAKIFKDIKKISDESAQKQLEVKSQLQRLAENDANNLADRESLTEFDTMIDEFTKKVNSSHFDFLKPAPNVLRITKGP